MPHPPIVRGIETVVSTLKQNNHTLVEWQPYKHEYAFNLINGVYASDGGKVRPEVVRWLHYSDQMRTSFTI